MRGRVVLGVVFLSGAFVLPATLIGQSIQGVVLSAEDRVPIELASVRLIDLARGGTATQMTGGEGRFQFRRAPGRVNQLEISALGYMTHVDTVYMALDEDSLALQILLGVDAIPLEPLVVVGSQRPVWENTQPSYLWEFFERQQIYTRVGMGRFYDRESLDKRFGPISTPTALETLLPAGSLRFRVGDDPGEQGRTSARYCRGNLIFLDGILFRGKLSEVWYSIQDLTGVEIYDAFRGVPAEFWTGRLSPCEVMSLWTRRPVIPADPGENRRGARWFIVIVGFAALMLGLS